MCHQSIGLIARHLEAAGFPTLGLTSARSITQAANPPRSVFVDLPLGHTAGPPNDAATQQRIIAEALQLGAAMTQPTDGEPGRIADLDLAWHDNAWKQNPLSWSRRQQDAGAAGSDAGDTRTGRSDQPQWQHESDKTAARGNLLHPDDDPVT